MYLQSSLALRLVAAVSSQEICIGNSLHNWCPFEISSFTNQTVMWGFIVRADFQQPG